MSSLTVKPRDLMPGDLIDRVTPDLDVAMVPIEKVVPVKSNGVTKSYKVYMHDPEDRPVSQRDSILRPFHLRPSQRVTVEREDPEHLRQVEQMKVLKDDGTGGLR